MTPVLYDYHRSSTCYRVRIALNLKGLPYQMVSIHLTRDGGNQRTADYRAINPQMRVPALALSGGERRRCEIARALASRPSYMLLDEPFAGIDPIAVADIQQLVRHLTARGIGVLITDHNVRETLGLIDRAYIIHAGQVLTHGRADEVVANPDVRRLYLGEGFTL